MHHITHSNQLCNDSHAYVVRKFTKDPITKRNETLRIETKGKEMNRTNRKMFALQCILTFYYIICFLLVQPFQTVCVFSSSWDEYKNRYVLSCDGGKMKTSKKSNTQQFPAYKNTYFLFLHQTELRAMHHSNQPFVCMRTSRVHFTHKKLTLRKKMGTNCKRHTDTHHCKCFWSITFKYFSHFVIILKFFCLFICLLFFQFKRNKESPFHTTNDNSGISRTREEGFLLFFMMACYKYSNWFHVLR